MAKGVKRFYDAAELCEHAAYHQLKLARDDARCEAIRFLLACRDRLLAEKTFYYAVKRIRSKEAPDDK